jgi:hypothetical protein
MLASSVGRVGQQGLERRASSGPTDTSLDLSFLGGTLDGRITFTRASTATYFDVTGTMQTAATNAPRFDFDPVSHAPRGLLIELARTNSLLNSGAPATQTTASLAAGTYTLWVVGTGSAASSAGTAVGTGFGTATAGVPNVITITTAGTVTVTVAGSLTRFQLENGAFPTSYVPTTGAAVARATDIATMPTGAWFNLPAGSLVGEAIIPQPCPAGTAQTIAQLDDGSVSNRIRLYNPSTTAFVGGVTIGGAGEISSSAGSIAPGTIAKIGLTYGTGNVVASGNGSAPISTAAGVPVAITSLRIGEAGAAPFLPAYGWIRRTRYWPRALSNTELQQVTT